MSVLLSLFETVILITMIRKLHNPLEWCLSLGQDRGISESSEKLLEYTLVCRDLMSYGNDRKLKFWIMHTSRNDRLLEHK